VVKIWDVLGGGKLLHTLKNHQKTVTCLCITPPMKASPSDAISAPRLMTGSLDGHIKVFDVSDFKVFPLPVLPFTVYFVSESNTSSCYSLKMKSVMFILYIKFV
jgi:U3 small nucleolar RNA-associated protein 15